MELATPQALAAILRRDRDALASSWEARARCIPGAERLPGTVLRDHVPALLEELARELEQPETARQRLREFSIAHGRHRHQAGMHLPQVVEEYKILRRCLIEHAEAGGLAVSGAGLRIVNELIDDGIETAMAAYIERRDAAEKQRRDEHLKFIVHDLRSPLAGIYYAILLAERELAHTNGGERVRAVHDAIKRNIERMRELIEKLLQEERNVHTPQRVDVNRETVPLWPIVESAMHTLAAAAANAGIAIVNRVPPDLHAHADAGLLERILQNLIANAVEHAAGGRIEIGAAAQPDGTVECWVSDNGRGMPEEARARLVGSLTGVSDSGPGLGLAVVRRLVDAHGGTIAVESEPGRGTTVRFSIPRA